MNLSPDLQPGERTDDPQGNGPGDGVRNGGPRRDGERIDDLCRDGKRSGVLCRDGERIDDLCRDGKRSNVLCRDGERIDDLQRNGLRIIQDPALFCFGMDAVLLSAYVQMKRARRGLDLCTGNGIIPLLLSDRTDCAALTGLEIQPASAGLAARSVALNGLEHRVSIVQGDLREADRIFAAASFDFITCNPPYRPAGAGRVSGGESKGRDGDGRGRTCGKPAAENSGKDTGGLIKHAAADGTDPCKGLDPRDIARHELLCTFPDIARAAAKLLRPGGHFYLVHRPMRLAEIITELCTSGLEPKRMRLVYPHADQAPNMVLLDCVRGGNPELRVEPPLIVYGQDGNYTPELMKIYYG